MGDKQRIDGITDICDSFESIYCEVTDTEVATVTSAAALDNDQQFEIAKKLQKLTGAKNIKLKPKVDDSLISGIIIQYGKGGSKLLDMSSNFEPPFPYWIIIPEIKESSTFGLSL